MKILIHPTYFPTIAQFVAIAKAELIIFEKHDNFQKQSYRNRTNIYGANGKLQLSVPVTRGKNGEKIRYSETSIKNVEMWQKQHWRSIVSAYKSSPFFEYYQDDIKHFFNETQTDLYQLNVAIYKCLMDCIELEAKTNFTETYKHEYPSEEIRDYRILAASKKEAHIPLEHYTQVFAEKHGYINNLSILDLLFNEGPNTINYLERQIIIF